MGVWWVTSSTLDVNRKYLQLTWGVLVTHALLLGWIAAWNSPVCDEVGHLTAGIYEWKFGHFFPYRVNPPLVKLIAAIPSVLGDPNLDWSSVADGPGVRTEFDVGKDFIQANRPTGYRYHTAGRLLCLPFTIWGAWMCYTWGRELYCPRSGFVACALWSFNPIVLGWGSTFTPDAAAASFGLWATNSFWKWLKLATYRQAISAGVVLGLCQLTKMTWIVLYPLWPAAWLVWQLQSPGNQGGKWRTVYQLLLLLSVAIYVVNVGYGFEAVGRRLGDFEFVSKSLTGQPQSGWIGNRFRNTVLAQFPVPFPANYVLGIDLQKVDFEKGMESYLWGVWSDRGWWYYYPVAACLKLPTGLILLGCMAVIRRPAYGRHFAAGEWLLFVPAMVVFVLICSQTGFGRYVRYLLPSLPAMLIFVSQLWSVSVNWRFAAIRNMLLAWAIFHPLLYYPHHISYFNELAGGPTHGYRYLLDANVDWGQDLIRLKHWHQTHPAARPLYCIHTGFVSPYDVGIECGWPPKASLSVQPVLEPGWYAVSIHELYQRHDFYHYLRDHKPIGRIGYSMLLFHIADNADQQD
jgi:Dolichyl-phosphate-mannose-protein mannosyltransferase